MGKLDDQFLWMKFHKDLSRSQVFGYDKSLQSPAVQGTKDLGLRREAQRAEVRNHEDVGWTIPLFSENLRTEPLSKYIRNPCWLYMIVHAFFCNLEQVVFLHSVLGVLLHNFCADDLAQHALSLAESCFAESRIAKSCISESYLPVSFMAGPAVCMRVLYIAQVHPESQTLHRASERLIKSIWSLN